ncbi:MAG: ATP-binding cassette domain-containing protein [Pseudomonadota bacterium]
MAQSARYFPLQLQQVSLIIGHSHCLQDIQLDICESGITAIMGNNGSGKTLLLKLISGLLTASHGVLRWQQQPSPPKLTFVPQSAALFDTSVNTNLKIPLKHQQHKAIEQRIAEALEWAGITHLRHKHITQLSTGEQHLVALARAWSLEPQIVLLDEPSANFDPCRRQNIDALIQDWGQSSKIIFSTHNTQQARTLADNIVLLDAGKVVCHQGNKTFFASPEFHQFCGLH